MNVTRSMDYKELPRDVDVDAATGTCGLLGKASALKALLSYELLSRAACLFRNDNSRFSNPVGGRSDGDPRYASTDCFSAGCIRTALSYLKRHPN